MTEINPIGASSAANKVDELKEKLKDIISSKAEKTSESVEKTDENELVEFDDEISDDTNVSADGTSSYDALISALQAEQRAYTKKLERIYQRLNKVIESQSKIQKEVNSITDSDTRENMQSKVEAYNKTINSLTSQASKCMSNIQSIASQIEQVINSKNSAEAAAAAAAASALSVGAASSTGSVSSTNSTSGATGTPSGYNAQRGQALADAAQSLYGGVSGSGGLCATGVSNSIEKVFGYHVYADGCTYGDELAKRSDWKEVTDQYPNASSLSSLPAGAVVSWSPYNTTSLGSIYGHVYIADGKGNEISDFKTQISTYYADRGGTYRVFVPV